jgi:hypothetical protein
MLSNRMAAAIGHEGAGHGGSIMQRFAGRTDGHQFPATF